MQYSRLQKSAASASALALFVSLSGVAALEKYKATEKYDWENTLSCAQCIRSDFVYVYENSATAQYFKEIPRGTAVTGFCCQKEAGASTYQCEKPPAGPDPRIASMWNYYTALTATQTAKPLMEKYMRRVEFFEKDGKEIYQFYLDKLIQLHADRIKVEADAAKKSATAPTDDGAGFLALLEQLKPRVVYTEFDSLLGRAKAIEYLQYIEIIKTYIGVNGGVNGDSAIAAAGAGAAYITADLAALTTSNAANNKNFYTKVQAQGRIDTAKDMAVWYDVEKIIGTTKKTEFKNLIAEVATKESIVASNVYIDYLYKAFDIQNTATYNEKLLEIRKRVANLRFRTCLDLEKAIAFNKLWIEMESYETKKGDDSLYNNNNVIIAANYTNNYIKTLVQTTTASTNTSANASIYTTELARLKLEVLWYYVSWNTNVTTVRYMKNYYTRLNTYSGVSNTLTTKETLFQGYKDDYNGTAQQDARFMTDFNAVRLLTFKAAIKFFMASDTPTSVSNADTYFLAFAQGNSTLGKLNITDAQLLTKEGSIFNISYAANATQYQTAYRNYFWEKLRASNTAYWLNTTGTVFATNGKTLKLTQFWEKWQGVMDAYDATQSDNANKVRKKEEKELQDLVVAANKTNFNTWCTDAFHDMFWRQAGLVSFDPSADLTAFKTVVLAGLYPTINDFYQPIVETASLTYTNWQSNMTSAYYTELRQRLRYEWATSATLGLARVQSMTTRARYKQKIDQRFTQANHVNQNPATCPVPTYGNQKWTDRTAYIDTLITKLENKDADSSGKGDVDSSSNALTLSAAWFLTNMEDPLDLYIFKNIYIPSTHANATSDRTDVDNYYSEQGGNTVAGVSVTAAITERRTLYKKFVDRAYTAASTDRDMGEIYYTTLINRCKKLVTSADTTGVWTESTLEAQFTTMLNEINAVTAVSSASSGTGRWDDGYDWYTKGRLMLLDTDNADFTEANMKTVVKTLREELLLLYYKELDKKTSTDSDLNDGTYGRAASLFKMFDYMLVIETGTAATEAAYDREQYIKALWDAKETDTDEDLQVNSDHGSGEEVETLRTYEQIYGEMTQRIDRYYLDILEAVVLNNANSSPTQADVERRMEAINFLRYDLWGTSILDTHIWIDTANMNSFTKYQNVVRTNLMAGLKTDYDAAGDGAAKVAAYTKWARKVDSTFVACMLYNDTFTYAGTLGTVTARAQTNSKYNAHWFYYWTTKIEDTTNYNTGSSFTVLQAALDAMVPELLKKTMNNTQKQTVVTHYSNVMYEFLKYQMKKTDNGKETVYIAALGGGWAAATNTSFGYSATENISKALTDAAADWTSVASTGAYAATTNFYYRALTDACSARRSTGWPAYNGGTDADGINHYPMYKTRVDAVGNTAGVGTTGDAAWKGFLATCYNVANARNFVFTTLDTWLKNEWANIISATTQTKLDSLYTATEFAKKTCSGACAAAAATNVVTSTNTDAYVKGLWDTDDTVLYTVASITNTAKVGYLFEIAWGNIADTNWTTTLNNDASNQTPIATTLELVTNDNAKFLRSDVILWIDNCLLGAATKLARWEYFQTAFLSRTAAYATLTYSMAVEDMLKHCLTTSASSLDQSSYGALFYSHADFITWYTTQRDVVITNTNWTNTVAGSSEPYYQVLFFDKSAGNATQNSQNTAPSELASQVKEVYDLYAQRGNAGNRATAGKNLIGSIEKTVQISCKQWVEQKSLTHTGNCTSLNSLATSNSGGVRYCHSLIPDLMVAMAAANDATKMTADNAKTFRNKIYWADIKCGPMNLGIITSSTDWYAVLTARCNMDATQCSGATIDTTWAIYKNGGTLNSTSDANKNILGLFYLEAFNQIFKDHNTAGSPPVSDSNWDTVWTAMKGTNVFVTGTAPKALTVGMAQITASTWYTTASWSAATTATNAGVQGVYDSTMKAGIEYEIDNETFTEGSSDAISTKECKAIIVGMNALTITGKTKPGTEFSREYMGAIAPAKFGQNEEWMYMKFWEKLVQQYYLNNNKSDQSAEISADYTANINTAGLAVTDYEGWYRANSVGWTSNANGGAVVSSGSYFCTISGRDACLKTMKKNIFNFKISGATGSEAPTTTLKTSWTTATTGVWAVLGVITDTSDNTTHPSGTVAGYGAKARFDAIIETYWDCKTKTNCDTGLQALEDQLYYERFLMAAKINDFKEITALVDFIEHAEAGAPLEGTYWTYYSHQLNECYVNLTDPFNRIPDKWELDYTNVHDCYQRWLGKVRFHAWNDLEEYIATREALVSNKPTFVAATLWTYRTTLRTRLQNDYWAVPTRLTGGKDSYDKFIICTTATTPTCDSVQSSLTASADGGSHPVVALTDGTDNVNFKIAGKKNSKDFTSETFALAACPHLEKNCGKKKIHLKNSRSAPVEIGINLFDSASSCQWLISAECALPAVNIFDMTPNIESQLVIEFIEWQDTVVKLDKDGYPKDVLTATPKVYKRPWLDDVGALPNALKVNATGDPEVRVQFLLQTLENKRTVVDLYNTDLFFYNLELEEWDNAVLAAKSRYQNQISKNQAAALAGPVDNSPGILDSILGAFGTSVPVAGPDPSERDLSELPQKPIVPDQPRPYTGITLDGIKADIGYGTLTEGLMSLRSDYGSKKFFGVTGQGFGIDTNYGYTLTPDLMKGCNNKYIALNVYPKGKSFKQGPDRLRFAVTAEEPADHDFSVPEKTVKPVPPQPAPSQTLINKFQDSWVELDEAIAAGGFYLGASATAAALVAASLF